MKASYKPPPATRFNSSSVNPWSASLLELISRSILHLLMLMPVHHCIGLIRTMPDQRRPRCSQGNNQGINGDTTYAVGQRLIVTQSTVLEFADPVERLGCALTD